MMIRSRTYVGSCETIYKVQRNGPRLSFLKMALRRLIVYQTMFNFASCIPSGYVIPTGLRDQHYLVSVERPGQMNVSQHRRPAWAITAL
jgi:hypothetical protein